MKVYVVNNEALYPGSSYHDIIGVFKTRKEARICIETVVKDLTAQYDRGDLDDIKSYDVVASLKNSIQINLEFKTDGDSFYELFEILEFDMKD